MASPPILQGASVPHVRQRGEDEETENDLVVSRFLMERSELFKELQAVRKKVYICYEC